MYPTELNEDGQLECFQISSSPEASKRRAGKILKEVFECEEFKSRFGSDAAVSLELWLGSHSLRKSAATQARKNGCSRDEVDLRGRWKKRKRQVDTYIDTEIPFPDAKVAAALCLGGPIAYQFVAGSGVGDNWVVTNVVPHLANLHFCKKTAARLGRAVLWACLDPLYRRYVPDELLKRVTSSYERIRVLSSDVNAIKKVGLVVVGNEGELYIDVLSSDQDVADPDHTGSDVSNANYVRRRQTAEMQAVFSQLASIKRQNELLQSELEITRTCMMNKLKKVAESVHRISISAQHSISYNNNTNTNNNSNTTAQNDLSIFNSTGIRAITIPKKAKLARNPKSLFILWQEFEYGIGGRKPAKAFTREERGAARFSYCRRNVFWQLVVLMVNRGHTANAAIDSIYQVYGLKESVTYILKKLVQDKKTHHRQFL